jgi:hypothetical protein
MNLREKELLASDLVNEMLNDFKEVLSWSEEEFRERALLSPQDSQSPLSVLARTANAKFSSRCPGGQVTRVASAMRHLEESSTLLEFVTQFQTFTPLLVEAVQSIRQGKLLASLREITPGSTIMPNAPRDCFLQQALQLLRYGRAMLEYVRFQEQRQSVPRQDLRAAPVPA